MFDFGFWELAIVLLVALLVVGPERLPGLAAQVGRWVGKARRLIQSVRDDIESEIRTAEMRDMLEKQQGEIRKLQSMISSEKKTFEEQVNPSSSGTRSTLEAVEQEVANVNGNEKVHSANKE